MAKIALISIYDNMALGLRQISSVLKKAGHHVSIIYLKKYENIPKKNYPPGATLDGINVGFGSKGEFAVCYPRVISDKEWEILIDFLRENSFDFVGLSVTSKYINTARAVTIIIQDKLGLKVIWGGVEPTINPDFDIQFADYICVGEGDEAVVEFADRWADKRDLTLIPNIWAKENGRIYRNNIRPLIQELDKLPFSDFSPLGKYEISEDKLWNRQERDCQDVYSINTSRGCPINCNFCIHHITRQMYKGQRYVRKYSVDYVLGLLSEAKDKYGIKEVSFEDDVFTVDKIWLNDFLNRYKKDINLPYYCFVSPLHCSREVCIMLKETGAKNVRLGVQSGSQRVLFELFDRKTPKNMMLKAANNLSEARLNYSVDIISDNPLENEDDCHETLEFLLSLPKPVRITGDMVFLMSFFPNYRITKIYQENIGKYKLDKNRYEFYNRLYLLSQYRPGRLVKILEKSRYFRRNPYKLRYFFPGQSPKIIQFIEEVITMPIRIILNKISLF